MDTLMIGTIGIIAFLVLMFLGMPVAISMILVGIIGLSSMLSPEVAFQMMGNDLLKQFSSYTMTVVALFSLMGFVANYSGIGRSLFKSINSMIGHRTGGLAIATDIACCIFGAICGSVPASIATMSSIAYPSMREYGYKDKLSASIIPAASALSIFIPPSVMLIIYGVATENSVGRCFAAGVVPGVVLCTLMAIAVVIQVKRDPSLAPKAKKATREERKMIAKEGGLAKIVIVFAVSIGGLFVGFFTATEAGTVGALGMILVALFSKNLNKRQFTSSMLETVKLSSMVILLVAGATIFGRLITVSRIPNAIGLWIKGLTLTPGLIMLIITIIYFIAGMFVDALAFTLVSIPIFYPIITDQLGFNGVWFCVYSVVVLSVGALTPPVGMNIFYMKGAVPSVKLEDMFRGSMPYIACMLLLIVFMYFFPQIVTWLPDFIYEAGV
jgi:tripartite ATP-independent transporter DctM subunit